jgi:hypothetical protein
MIRSWALAAFSLLCAASIASAQSSPKDMAARTELHAIQTLTLSDPQFLAGDASGTPTTIAGQLRLAQGSGRLPAVVLMHGSGGMGANIEMWTREFNSRSTGLPPAG